MLPYNIAVNGAVNVAITSTEILAASDTTVRVRQYALITNDSDTVIYLALGATAVVNEGIRLNANGGSFEINQTNRYCGAINGIHGGTGSKVVCVVEGS